MESGRLFFDPSACQGNMSFLGNGDPLFQGARSVMMSMEEISKRRPFFSSPDDLFDDVYYDEQLPEKKRRLTSEQVNLLEKSFEAENKLEPERKSQLAKKVGLQPRQVAVWFQNRRARWRTKQLERDYDILKSSFDALLSNYDTLVQENGKLKSEVVSLKEKLEAKEENKESKSDKNEEPTVEMTNICGLQQQLSSNNNNNNNNKRKKTEDWLSGGSVGSAVVDEGDGPHQLVVDSYFGGCVGPVDTEEEDGSDDGRSYFSDVLVVAPDHQHHEEPLMTWWESWDIVD